MDSLHNAHNANNTRIRRSSKAVPKLRLRLTTARLEKGFSQRELAEHIGSTDVNVSRWERGITRPNPYFRRKLSTILGKSEQELDLERGFAEQLSSSDIAIEKEDGVEEVVNDEDSRVSGHRTTAHDHGATPRAAPARQDGAPVPIYDPTIPLQPTTRLVGRDAELTDLKQRLCEGGNVALTALNGLPGVGKTALSIALAHDDALRRHFHDGILWAGLGPTPSISSLLSRWGTLLGLSVNEMAHLSSSEDWAIALRTAIASRTMLLVIDDAWEIEDALTFRVGGPNCAHLLTTRFPHIALQVADEGATALKELGDDESLTLLRQLAPQAVALEERRALDLIHAVGGLPLALTLLGNYLRNQAYGGKARRISSAMEHLSDAEVRLKIQAPRGPVERHPSLPTDTSLSLQSVFAVTDQRLDTNTSAALYALSVFPPKPNSFKEEAALAVANCSLESIDALCDAGLLESSIEDRYTLHQTITDYARTRLKETVPHERLLIYLIFYIEGHKKDYELLDAESTTILAALEYGYELGFRSLLIRCACAIAPYFLLRSQYAVAEKHLQRAHEAAHVLQDSYGITCTLLYLGQIAQKQSDFTTAETRFQEGLRLARMLGDRENITAFLTDLGAVAWRRGEYAQAEQYMQEGSAIARELGDRARVSTLLKALGLVALSRGDYIQSETYLQEGLNLARQIEDREQMCSLLMNLGVVAGSRGNHAEAERYFKEGLVLARQIGDRERISALLSNLGNRAKEEGNYVLAETYFQEGLLLARQIGNREWTCALLINLGEITLEQENNKQAEIYLQEGLKLARQIGRPHMIAGALYFYGSLYLNMQQITASKESFRTVLTTIPEGDQELIALTQYGSARVAVAQGNIQEARRLGEVSVTSLEAIGHRKAQEVKNWLYSIEN